MEDLYNVNDYTDKELLDILELNNPTDRELEAKILHQIWKYKNIQNASGEKLTQFFQAIYDRFFEETVSNEIPEPIAEMPKTIEKINTSATPVLSQQVGYSIDKLNPVFKETTKRLVSIDSSYRDASAITTDYTFNLSNPLKDVVNLRLYSVQIPYTWYTINSNFGSNFLYLKSDTDVLDDIKVEIPVGNYTASDLITTVNIAFQNLKTNEQYLDISFGQTQITYDNPSSRATIAIDIKKTYTASNYSLGFSGWTTPNAIDRSTSIPSFLGFNEQTYTTNAIRSLLTVLPPNALSQSDNTISRYPLTASNNFFTIYQYTGTYPSAFVELNRIVVSLSLPTGTTYSRTQLYTDFRAQLIGNPAFTTGTDIVRIDETNPAKIGYGNSHYKLSVVLNRLKTKNETGIKMAIVFPANSTDIWYGISSAFVFENPYYETSNIVSETKAPSTTIVINSNPSIKFKCIKPTFDISLNDYTIVLPNTGYTLTSYINTVNALIVDASDNGIIMTSETNLSIVDSKINIKVNINKPFLENQFQLDVSNSFFLRRTNVGFTQTEPVDIQLRPAPRSVADPTTDISGSFFTQIGEFALNANEIVMTIRPKPTSAVQNVSPYVVRNTGSSSTQASSDIMAAIITNLLNNFTDPDGVKILAGSTFRFLRVGSQLKAIVNIRIDKYISEKDYQLQFNDSAPTNSWITNLKLGTDVYNLADASYNVVGQAWSEIDGSGNLSTDFVVLTNSNNVITLTPSANLGTITTRLDVGTYTRDQLLSAINAKFVGTVAEGTVFSVVSSGLDEYIQIALNINKTYTMSDYRLVFYDPVSFVRGFSGNINMRNTSWDSTLGWVLGFHESTEYDLSVKSVLTGDNVVSINMYNYFMILLDDYNHNHMNDGIVTSTKQETDVRLPSYSSRANNRLDPITGLELASNTSATGTTLTQKQVYASQAVIDQKARQITTLKYASGPFAKNVFGLIPLKISGLPNNSVFVETGIKDQERNYFGPVNIQRMSVRLLNDKGEIVDLNGANWSFSFICEQLYQNNRAPA
jgi:hypothetical protein